MLSSFETIFTKFKDRMIILTHPQ